MDVYRVDAFALLNCARYVESYGGTKRGKETKQRIEAAIASNDTRHINIQDTYEFRTFTYINSITYINSYFSMQSFLYCTKIYY